MKTKQIANKSKESNSLWFELAKWLITEEVPLDDLHPGCSQEAEWQMLVDLRTGRTRVDQDPNPGEQLQFQSQTNSKTKSARYIFVRKTCLLFFCRFRFIKVINVQFISSTVDHSHCRRRWLQKWKQKSTDVSEGRKWSCMCLRWKLPLTWCDVWNFSSIRISHGFTAQLHGYRIREQIRLDPYTYVTCVILCTHVEGASVKCKHLPQTYTLL